MSYENTLKKMLEDNKLRIYKKQVDINPEKDSLGEKIAKKLGVRYDGWTDLRKYGKEGFLNFTDMKYGGSFMATDEKGDLDSDRIVWSVQATSPHVLKSTCLTNALTPQVLLSRNGYPSQLGKGVTKDEEFEAHAWREMNGEVIVGKIEEKYTPLVDLD